ncbi:iron-containing redox enzyme family protein [Sorangium sp. So ce1078]|uniref:iron-containing redox enzyme family protein n=1 Tax=Sorangium sp. So ce1078 TaxID=3133329 RepID=UPI003F634F5D
MNALHTPASDGAASPRSRVSDASPRAMYRRLRAGEPAPEDLAGEPAPEAAAPGGLDALWAALNALRDEDERGGAPGGEGVDAARVLLGYAPTALLDGCWLAATVRVRHADGALGAACLDAFYLECGEGDPARHHGALYGAALAAAGLALPDPASPGFERSACLADADFALAIPGLRVAQLGDARLPEALGHHAAATVLGPPAVVRRAAARARCDGLYFAEHAEGAETARRARDLARLCLEAHAAGGAPDWSHVWRGAWSLWAARRAWIASLRPAAARSAWEAMLALIEAKARHAFGFHGRVRIDGQALDDALDPARLDARRILLRLARSPWIVPGRPDESPLVTRSVQFGGPMFGVFTDAEVDVMRAWIGALAEAPEPPASLRAARGAEERAGSPRVGHEGASIDVNRRGAAPRAQVRAGLPLPELYHRLLCARGPGDVDRGAGELARAHVEGVLRAVRREVSPSRLAADGRWPWSAAGLSRWVDARLHEQIFEDGRAQSTVGPQAAPHPARGRAQSTVGPQAAPHPARGRAQSTDDAGIARELTRGEAVWLLTQLAPAAVIDGAWLQGATAPGGFHTPVAPLLLRIYRDELGAGVPAQHHGNVLRRALAEQGLTLPPCDARAFVERPDFLPQAFSMPVLWLAVAQRSTELLPELLGLNLAVEMAGIGRGYAMAAALLRRHRIDPYFFDLHNTIDNAASGHTAWSIEAITRFMDACAARGDALAIERAALRLWRGYAAYAHASRPLLRAVAVRLGPRLGWRWLRRQLLGTTGR